MDGILKGNRKHSKIDKLSPDLKDTVDEMLLTHCTYAEIVKYLSDNGIGLSQASVSRYAQGLAKNAMAIQIAGENFRLMAEQMEKYPKVDTAGVLLQLASQNVHQALSEVSEEDFKEIDLEALLRQTNGLVRATAYKSRIDLQNQDSYEAGLDAVKVLVFETMAKEDPELYEKVSRFLTQKKQANEV